VLAAVVTAAILGAASTPDTSGAAGAYTLPDTVRVLPPVLVIGDRVPRQRLVPASRAVIDRAELEHRDPLDLGDALRPVAGLRIAQLGDGVGTFATIRGLGAERVAVLVDGRPLNPAQGGGVDLSGVDLEGLERIEVTRGAAGALAGPDALGGAVDLVRRRDRASGWSLRALGGTADRALLRAAYTASHGRCSLDGSARAETLAPELGSGLQASSRGLRGRFALAYHPRWAAVVEAGAEAAGAEREVPGSAAFPTPEARQDDAVGEAYVSLRGASALGGAVSADVSELRRRRGYRDPAAPLGAVDDTHRNRRARAAGSWRRGDDAAWWHLGVEAIHDGLESTTDGDVSRDRGAVFGEWCAAAGAWSFAPSLRMDAVEEFGAAGSGRAAVSRAWGGSTLWTARVGAGTGFRPPTFDDLFWPARASAAGNPDLASERAYDLDLGLSGVGPWYRAEGSGFWNRVDSMIQWVPGADGVWRPHNVGRARLRGIEISGEAAAGSAVSVNAAYTFLDARDAGDDPVTGGKRLVNRPAHQLFAEAGTGRGAWSAATGVLAVGEAALTTANTKWRAGYALWHARLRWQANPRLRFDLEMENLTDTDYEDVRGYATPGREVLLGFRYAAD